MERTIKMGKFVLTAKESRCIRAPKHWNVTLLKNGKDVTHLFFVGYKEKFGIYLVDNEELFEVLLTVWEQMDMERKKELEKTIFSAWGA